MGFRKLQRDAPYVTSAQLATSGLYLASVVSMAREGPRLRLPETGYVGGVRGVLRVKNVQIASAADGPCGSV